MEATESDNDSSLPRYELITAVKIFATHIGIRKLRVLHSKDRLQAIPSNIRLGWKGLKVASPLVRDKLKS